MKKRLATTKKNHGRTNNVHNAGVYKTHTIRGWLGDARITAPDLLVKSTGIKCGKELDPKNHSKRSVGIFTCTITRVHNKHFLP